MYETDCSYKGADIRNITAQDRVEKDLLIPRLRPFKFYIKFTATVVKFGLLTDSSFIIKCIGLFTLGLFSDFQY